MVAGRGAESDTDAELLGRYAAGRCDEAFAALVRRYGPMVFAVCRRVLGNGPDADDAFQATFLVLARKAGTLTDPAKLPGFLYGVAYRTALHAKSRRARRRVREGAALPDVAAPTPRESHDVFAVLDREVAALPAKYRDALALVDLAGVPRPAAAARLAVPEGTLSSRLAEGRKRLAGRLRRLGFAPAAVAGAAVPENLFAAPPSLHAQFLATGVLRAMTPWKLPAAAAAIAAGLGLNAALSAAPQAPAAPAVDSKPAAAARPDGDGDKKVEDAPPVVRKTVPAAGADDVASELTEIRVTFSKVMGTKGWSWPTDTRFGAEVVPTDKIHFDDARTTCVLPCKLKPKTTYAVWINSERFQNFTDAAGTPAVPYLLVFRTK